MAVSTMPYICIRCRPSHRLVTSKIATRSYATTVGETSPASHAPRRTATRFSDRLNAGPSFTDFVSPSRKDALELRTVVVGPPGKQKKITRLPEWLKTPIPEGDNFKRLKNDLRGLNLHTGKSTKGTFVLGCR